MLTERTAIPVPAAPPDEGPPSKDAERRARLAAAFLAARDGDRGAMELLVTELSPMLWHVARAQGLARDDAVDVVQNTWLALVGSIGSIRNPSALAGWLVVTTKRDAWRVRAGRVKEPLVTEPDVPEPRDTGPTPEELALADDQRGALWAAISLLSARCQELMRVIAFTDRPDYDAVSAALGMPRGSIGPTRGRCLAKLRQLLDEQGERRWGQ